jgi:hypothetical protein
LCIKKTKILLKIAVLSARLFVLSERKKNDKFFV